MKTIKRFCDAISFLLLGATASGFLILIAFANGMEIRLPAGNMPVESRDVGYSKSDRAKLEEKYHQALNVTR